jgi:hypothetical protein
MAILTNKSDVIENFVRYHGRQPNTDELKSGGLIEYLTTKAPKEVETLLAKNSPITGGLIWADYQKQQAPATPTSTTPKSEPKFVPKPTSTPTYDPFKEAEKYGYTKEDFANDPGFENYWKNKTPEELAEQLKLRKDFDISTGKKKVEEVEEIEEIEEIEEETEKTEESIWDTIIDNSVFLKEQLSDTEIKSQFDSLPDELKSAYLQLLRSMEDTVKAGEVINPNIEITPEQIQKFTKQATSELDPYYQEQIKFYQQDLDTSISRLTEDFKTGVRNAEDPFKRNLAAQAEAEAQAGLTYGSERNVREKTAIQQQQQAIDEIAKQTGRSIEDTYKQAERTLGSDILGGVDTSLPTYGVSKQGFSPLNSRSLFSPTGGLVGSLPKERTVAIKGRESELEEEFRKKRILNTSQL